MIDPTSLGPRPDAARLTTLSCLVVEDHDLMAEGILRAATGAGLHPIRRVSTLGAAFMCRSPDVVLLDLSLPDSCRLDTVAKAIKRWPRSRILVLSADVDSDYAVMLLRTGVQGVVSKDASIANLQRLITAAANHRFALTPEIAGALSSIGNINERLKTVLSLVIGDCGFDDAAEAAEVEPDEAARWLREFLNGSNIPLLTPAQLRVLLLVEAGMSNKAVASALNVRVKTIERHLRDVRQRMQLPEGEARQLGAFAQRLHRGCLLTTDEHLGLQPPADSDDQGGDPTKIEAL
jgi:DNA-binding NarL/FixJ family response regulator